MAETLRFILLVFLVVVLFTALFYRIANDPTDPIKQYEEKFKKEYEKYKDYLFDDEELILSRPQKLDITIPSDSFKTNKELRHSLMQVAKSLQNLYCLEKKRPDKEFEEMYYKLKRFSKEHDEA